MNSSTLTYLIKHEFKFRKRNCRNRKWIGFYGVAIAALIAIAYGFLHATIVFQPTTLLFFVFVFPYAGFMRAMMTVSKEWKDGTYGWWLTLPYSRGTLLRAKYIASGMWMVILGLSTLAVTVVVGICIMWIQGHLEADALSEFLSSVAIAYLFIYSTLPLMLGFGIFASIVRHSNWKPAMPLIWVCYGFSGNLLSWVPVLIIGDNFDFTNLHQMIGDSMTWLWLVVMLATSCLIGALMMWIASKLMKKQLTL
ncbi:ABC-2 transporter permease [Paenibacillus marinisediminis]